MTAVRIACLLLALVAGAATLPGEARALDPPTASCNGGGCGGWFRSSVTVVLVLQREWSHGHERLRGGDDRGRHAGRHVHVHGELRRVVRREQRHREERTRRRPG